MKYPYFRMSKAEESDRHLNHFLDHFEKTGISAAKLRHEAVILVGEEKKEETIYVYSIWRMGDEAHGTKRNMENIGSVNHESAWYGNPKIVERVNGFPDLERLGG